MLLRAILLLLACCLAPAWGQEVQPVPALSGRVIDQTGTLSAAELAALNSKLEQFEREVGSQIVILMVPTVQPEDIAAYAQRVADTWKIGRRDVGDGLLIVVAKEDRRLRIEVAKALEGAVPDLAAKQIIDRALKPAFKKGDFAGGLDAAVDLLAARIRGEGLPAPPPERASQFRTGGDAGGGGESTLIFFVLGVLAVSALLKAVLGRTLGVMGTSAVAGLAGWLLSSSIVLAVIAGVVGLILAAVGVGNLASLLGNALSVGSHHGGGFGGGGGGGGFFSGGGGDFGGGGASGDW